MWAERNRLTSSGKALGGAARVRTGEDIFMTWAVLQGVRGSRAVEGLLFPKGRIGLDAARVRAVERKRLSMGNWSLCGPRVPWSFLCAPGLSAPRVFLCGELCLRKSSALSARGRRSALSAGDKGDGCEGGD